MNSTYNPLMNYPVLLTESATYTLSASSGALRSVSANQYTSLPDKWVTTTNGAVFNYFTSFSRIATGSANSLIAGYEPDPSNNEIGVRLRNYTSSSLSNVTLTVDYNTPVIR